MYSVKLTADEYDAMGWFEARGYFPGEIIKNSDEDWTLDESEVTLTIPEHVAWSLAQHREEASDSLYACMSPELRAKWQTLEESII